MDFHQRKIQKFAKYSFAITLPKHWVTKNNLEPSDKNSKNQALVNMVEQADGSLALYPVRYKKPINNHIDLFELDDVLKRNPDFIKDKGIQLILISYYMNGSIGLKIVSKNPIPAKLIIQIEQTQSRLLFNWNLNRISSRELLIKNVFSENPENIFQEEIPRYLRESFSILLWMLDDIQNALEKNDYEKLKDLSEQDQKIDRYYFFIVRQIRTIFDNPQITKPLNYSHKKLIDLRLLAKIIEDVGDSLKDIGDILYNLHDFIRDIGLMDYLQEYFVIIQDDYGKLADFLRLSVAEQTPSFGMNEEIMKLIQKFRKDGRILENKWENLSPGNDVFQNGHTFQDYIRGARLIQDLEEVFKNVFDFTNVFF
ncbi:MAG: PhoU domain-containing protein [Promethearchaeota archaeon]